MNQTDTSIEEGSEVTPVNGDPHSESIASELGPGAEKLQGERNVNIESLYEVGSLYVFPLLFIL